jgi:hypothetical protein
MNIQDIDLDHCDDISKDELLYDNDAMVLGMNNIIENTKNNILFDELYSLAAAKMFSIDKETGLCILLCYDFFAYFIPVYETFLREPDSFNNENILFIELKQKLSN